MSSVTDIRPIDTTGIRDIGCRGIILLAHSLGWNVVLHPGNPCTLIAPDGAKLRVPTTTTVNSGVFQGYVSKIMTHSTERTPTVELMDRVIAVHKKMSDDEKRRLRLAVGESPQQHRERLTAIDAGPKEIVQEGGLTQHIEVPEAWERVLNETPSKPTPVIVKPILAAKPEEATQPLGPMPNPWRQAQQPADGDVHMVSSKPFIRRVGGGGDRTEESDRIIEQQWSDGSTTYKCTWCTFTAPKVAAFAGHGRAHMKERTPVNLARKAGQRVEPPTIETVDAVETPTQVIEPDDLLTDNDRIVEQIRQLVGGDSTEELEMYKEENDQLTKENQHLTNENTKLIAENERLSADWRALQDLLGKGKP